MHDALLSSEDDTWQTPEEELRYVRAVGDIVLDPATAVSNPTRAPTFYALESPNPKCRDGLVAPWTGILSVFRAMPAFRNPLVFLNPPYGRALAAWAAKVREEALKGAQIITLTPARTDTGWWQDMAEVADDGLLLRGRITFIDSATGKPRMAKVYKGSGAAKVWTGKWTPSAAPFPVFYGYFGKHPDLFKEAFAGRGRFLSQPIARVEGYLTKFLTQDVAELTVSDEQAA